MKFIGIAVYLLSVFVLVGCGGGSGSGKTSASDLIPTSSISSSSVVKSSARSIKSYSSKKSSSSVISISFSVASSKSVSSQSAAREPAPSSSSFSSFFSRSSSSVALSSLSSSSGLASSASSIKSSSSSSSFLSSSSTLLESSSSSLMSSSSSKPSSSFSSEISSSLSSSVVSTRFAVIGDYGWEGKDASDVAALVKKWLPEYVVTVGDNNYMDGLAATIDANVGQYYSDFISPYIGKFGQGSTTNRFYPALGNHDWNTGNIQPYLDYFTLPGNERYYDFVKGPVHFFVIDSDDHEPDGVDVNSSQAQWLHNKLSTATETWKLVVMHHAPYSSGDHGSVPIVRWPFKEWGADAVLSGHDHDYERFYVNGMTYLVNGLGGRSLYIMRTPLPDSHFRYNSDFGALLVEATDSMASFKFVQRTGAVLDVFTLSKGFPHKLPYVFFRGTANNWGVTPMRLTGENTWQVDVTFGAAIKEAFKFDVFGDWTQAYGDANNDSIADNGGDIPVTLGAGHYRVEFNDATNRYTMLRLNTP